MASNEQRCSRRRLSFEARNTEDKQQCHLCHGHHQKVNSPSQWKSDDARRYVESLNVPADGLICQTCRKDITKVLSDSMFVPRWKKSNDKRECCIQQCSNTVFASLHKTSEQVQSAIQSGGLKCSLSTVPTPAPLCKHHYHLVYNLLQPTQIHCITCGMSLKHSNTRLCPQPKFIENHLKENMGFVGTNGGNDKVCYICYRSHLVILQQQSSVSKDSDLQQLITTVADQIPTSIQSTSELVDATMKRVVVAVGKELLDRNVLLLPSVYDLFCSQASELSCNLEEEVDTTKLVTSAWIMSSLKVTLKNHIVYTCKIRKYGTLIYRPNTDLASALSRALWQLRTIHKVPSEIMSTASSAPVNPCPNAVLDDLNLRAQSLVKTQLSTHAHTPPELDDINIDKMIEETDSKLWEAICLLTRSISERRGTSKVNDPSSPSYQSKKTRRFYLLCALLFCINDRCSLPIHTLITDLIEGQGGSALLIRILNRLGVCASVDTLACFIQDKVSSENSLSSFLHPESFTIVSADNIDFLHSYARVFKGSKNSSWHGTSVQAVQPLPSLSIHSEVHMSDTHVHQDTGTTPADFVIPLNSATESRTTTDISNNSITAKVSITDRPSQPLLQGHLYTASCFLTDETTSYSCSEASSSEITHPIRKRAHRSSPFQSPLKLTRSPAPKQRRLRTGTEKHTLDPLPETHFHPHNICRNSLPQADKSLSDFLLNELH